VLDPRGGGHFFSSAAGKKISVSADSGPKKKTESQRTGRPAKKKNEEKIHGSGRYYIHNRARAEPAPSAALRSRSHSAAQRTGGNLLLCVSPCRRQEGQVGNQETPYNTEGLPLFSRGAVRASW
jgi:hypothetical protein